MGAAARPALAGEVEAEVCVVGGGLAGLSTALGLAERGTSVALVEARRLAWGASGRNGGFVSAGFALNEEKLVARVGRKEARRLYALTREAVALVKRRIERYAIPCDPVDGILAASWFDDRKGIERDRDFMADTFAVDYELWPRERVRERLKSRRYFDGLFNREGFHFHPLNYALGIAAAAESAGARMFEASPAVALDLERPTKTVSTPEGRVRAREVVVACGGYIGRLEPRLMRATLPIATYVMATEPLGERLATAVTLPYAIHDTRFVLDYYRPLNDTRLLWGGRVSARTAPPARLASFLLGDVLKVYPQLKGARVEAAWAGLMGYPVHRMPQIGRLSPGLWYAMGFAGHGMGTTTMAGELLAAAIADGDDRYRLFEPFGLVPFPRVLAPAAAQLAYWAYGLRDSLKAWAGRPGRGV
ncbi:MAG: NAD(P)/FAD-dependent oxidoreductase [Alphaproteobacteria bacterium]